MTTEHTHEHIPEEVYGVLPDEGVVELTEGPRVVGRIEGIDALNPINIKIGIPLKVKFLHRGANENPNTVLAFTPL